MSRLVWRIATDTRDYEADDISGSGASLTGGRWNEVGLPVVYGAENRALACLETIVHLNAGGLPLNRYLVEIAIPDALWDAAEIVPPDRLDVGWDALPAARPSIRFGSEWIRSRRSALLRVPSVIVPEEIVVLLNPEHPQHAHVRARKIRKWVYDPRTRSASS